MQRPLIFLTHRQSPPHFLPLSSLLSLWKQYLLAAAGQAPRRAQATRRATPVKKPSSSDPEPQYRGKERREKRTITEAERGSRGGSQTHSHTDTNTLSLADAHTHTTSRKKYPHTKTSHVDIHTHTISLPHTNTLTRNRIKDSSSFLISKRSCFCCCFFPVWSSDVEAHHDMAGRQGIRTPLCSSIQICCCQPRVVCSPPPLYPTPPALPSLPACLSPSLPACFLARLLRSGITLCCYEL